MALTKNNIVEQIQTGCGFPRNKSVEITESLLELIKSSLESGVMSLCPASASSV